MIVVPTTDQRAQCLISPLALHKAPKDFDLRFKKEVDRVIVHSLLEMSVVTSRKLSDQSWIALVATMEVREIKDRTCAEQSWVSSTKASLQLRGDHIGFWCCHCLSQNEATYWYHSHMLLATIGFPQVHMRYGTGGRAGLRRYLDSTLLHYLRVQKPKISRFARTMQECGMRERVL